MTRQGNRDVNRLDDLLNEYAQMRGAGQEARSVLYALRGRIETLDPAQRDEFAALVRAWEARGTRDAPTRSSPIRPIAPLKRVKPSAAAAPQPRPDTGGLSERVNCPHCGRVNKKQDVFCYACGQVLEMRTAHDTKHFSDSGETASSELFGPETVLTLRVRGSVEVYELRPQKLDHELVIGRSTAGSAIMPDLDLNSKQAADLGVSRMHLSVRYDAQHQALMVTDLGSANGSFINGQRLLPREVRVLRHGDELRLGRLVLMVAFHHPQ